MPRETRDENGGGIHIRQRFRERTKLAVAWRGRHDGIPMLISKGLADERRFVSGDEYLAKHMAWLKLCLDANESRRSHQEVCLLMMPQGRLGPGEQDAPSVPCSLRKLAHSMRAKQHTG